MKQVRPWRMSWILVAVVVLDIDTRDLVISGYGANLSEYLGSD